MLRDAETTSIAERMRRSPVSSDAAYPPPRRRARFFFFFVVTYMCIFTMPRSCERDENEKEKPREKPRNGRTFTAQPARWVVGAGRGETSRVLRLGMRVCMHSLY